MRIRGCVVKSWIKGSAAFLLIFLASGISSAHANTLVATSPIAGSTLKAGPSAVSITTELPLMEFGNEISVTDPNGKRIDTGILTVVGTDAVAEMKPLETSGLYKVSYLLFAEEDVPLEGSFTFTYSAIVISTPSATVNPGPSASAQVNLNGSDAGTNLFVIFLLVMSFLVLVGMGAYARKIFKER